MDGPQEFEREDTGWWGRLDRLIDEAGALPGSERRAFLDRVCGDEPALRAEVASLLAHADSGEAVISSIASSLRPPPRVEDAASLDSLIGRTLHQYTIEARLGSGGMGVVYRALDTRLGRQVALKFIWPGHSADPESKTRLLVEARAAAALDHPNVCTIHEVGESGDGGLFIAMGYYEGETLSARLGRGPLSVQEAVDTIRQAAEGVRAAHTRGITHCDIKPSNVLVTRDGVVKLLDFGIAVAGEPSRTGREGLIGTMAYMSPEQLRGEPVDARSDIWSLGVVAYELLAARRPFQGESPARTAEAVLHAAPLPLAGSREDVPQALEAVILQALAKDPCARPQSVEELVSRLVGSMEGGRAHPVPASPGRRVAALPGAVWSRHRRKVLLGIGVGVLGWSGAVSLRMDSAAADEPVGGPRVSASTAGEPRLALAVLRFEDPTAGGPSGFTHGITEAIQAEIQQIRGLQVIGHFSAMIARETPSERTLFGAGPGGHCGIL